MWRGSAMLVDRRRRLLLHRLDGAQIGNDGVEIARREDFIEIRRHDRGEPHAVRPLALLQRLLDVGIAPVADAGLLVLRDVRGGHLERRLVELEPARQIALEDRRAALALRRVAVLAGEDGVDEILAALDRRLGKRTACRCEPCRNKNRSTNDHGVLRVIARRARRRKNGACRPLGHHCSYSGRVRNRYAATKKGGSRAALSHLLVASARYYAAAGASSVRASTGPESLPRASTSRSTNSITPTGAESPWR